MTQDAGKNHKAKNLTQREKALFKLLLEGKSLTEAAPLAGYSPLNAGQSGYQALENIKKKAPHLFERHGLDDDTFIEKHIKPALEATHVKVFFVRGHKKKPSHLVYSKPLPAWGPRMAAVRLVAEMKGMIVKEQEKPASGIRVLVINGAHRPPRPELKPIPHIPGLPTGKLD